MLLAGPGRAVSQSLCNGTHRSVLSIQIQRLSVKIYIVGRLAHSCLSNRNTFNQLFAICWRRGQNAGLQFVVFIIIIIIALIALIVVALLRKLLTKLPLKVVKMQFLFFSRLSCVCVYAVYASKRPNQNEAPNIGASQFSSQLYKDDFQRKKKLLEIRIRVTLPSTLCRLSVVVTFDSIDRWRTNEKFKSPKICFSLFRFTTMCMQHTRLI